MRTKTTYLPPPPFFGRVRLAFALTACALIAGASSCSTIVNGTKQTVSFNSTPEGAKVYLDGSQIGVTPHVCKLERGKYTFVEMRKDGFDPGRYQMTESMTAGSFLIGNTALTLFTLGWGICGFIVDPLTGAMWEYDQPNVNLELSPIGASVKTPE